MNVLNKIKHFYHQKIVDISLFMLNKHSKDNNSKNSDKWAKIYNRHLRKCIELTSKWLSERQSPNKGFVFLFREINKHFYGKNIYI